jgi:hypothetical protein
MALFSRNNGGREDEILASDVATRALSVTAVETDFVSGVYEKLASVYDYTTKLIGVEAAGEGEYAARVHLEGNFPGGTVDLQYRFTVDGDVIRRLEIAP